MSRLMRAGLAHKHPGYKQNDFFEAIAASGGWPEGYQYVGFEHTDERKAGFCNSPNNTGWWTVVYTADDYYLWKLSPAALQRLVDDVRQAIHVPAIDASKLSITTSRRYKLERRVPAAALAQHTGSDA